MNSKIWIFILLCGLVCLINKVSAQTARCDYKYDYQSTTGYKTTNASYYTCYLSTRQANYYDKLTRIDYKNCQL